MDGGQPKLTLWTGQAFHLAGLVALASLLGLACWKLGPLDGTFLGLSADAWFYLSICFPVAHQLWVWVCWRLELTRNRATSRCIGFRGYLVGFFVLFLGRFLAAVGLGIANHHTLDLPLIVRIVLALMLLVPAAWTGHSVVTHFGLKRAAGADHFETRYRTMPLVNLGIFRYTSNGMYLVGFLFFWGLAVALASLGVLLVAAFAHAYVWVHHLATEKPDMQAIYGPEQS